MGTSCFLDISLNHLLRLNPLFPYQINACHPNDIELPIWVINAAKEHMRIQLQYEYTWADLDIHEYLAKLVGQ